MICPRCNSEASVVDVRQHNAASTTIRRRRQCACGRFNTFEIREEELLQEIVVTSKIKVGVVGSRIAVDDETSLKFVCECGNEARYSTDGHAAPRWCAICDMLKNEGKGLRV